jgi:type I restriction enzyme, S subunit
MAGEWPTLTLREANVTLIDCDHRTPPAADDGYPYVAIPQLRNGRLDLSDVRRISREAYIEWTLKANPRPNDVVLSRRCNPGETAVAPSNLEFALGQNLVLLRADGTRVHPPFLRWLVRGPEWWEQISKFINVGAVFDSLRCADVPSFALRVPPLPAQRAIAHILGTLDDKIELNRQMSETLEGMARALFKSWFVDFDPVRAKAEGRDPGLPQPLADLFPARLVDSDLGEIPEGWEVTPLAQSVDVVRGLSYKGSGLSERGVPMHNLNSIYEGGVTKTMASSTTSVRTSRGMLPAPAISSSRIQSKGTTGC